MNENITTESIIKRCDYYSRRFFNLSIEDFANTDIGYIDVIVPVYIEFDMSFDKKEFQETSELQDSELEDKIHDAIFSFYDDDYYNDKKNADRYKRRMRVTKDYHKYYDDLYKTEEKVDDTDE